MQTIKNPYEKVFSEWSKKMKPKVGKGNYSMGASATIASAPFARLQMLGSPGNNWDLEGDECAIYLTFQAESFADGQTAITDVYDIDDVSHKAMTEMGFRRIYGPEIIDNVDSDIKRVVSRYTLLYTGSFLV